jgi:RNA exonuclease 4
MFGFHFQEPRSNYVGPDTITSITMMESSNTTETPTTTKRRRRRTRGRKQGKQSAVSKLQQHDDDEDATTVASSGSDRSDQPHQQRRQQQQRSSTPLTPAERDRYLAMDCEMVGVGVDGLRSALARVTLVDWDGEVVYDAFVTPTEEVTDYRYFVSGITEQDLLQYGLDFATCRQQVAALLTDKILIGHALKNDLAVLQLSHPWHAIRDTAKYEPFMKKLDETDHILWPRKLKELTQEKLKREIQPYGTAHCPIQDAVAALQLYQLVRTKWENIMDYKIHKTAEIMQRQQQQLLQQQQHQAVVVVDVVPQ